MENDYIPFYFSQGIWEIGKNDSFLPSFGRLDNLYI